MIFYIHELLFKYICSQNVSANVKLCAPKSLIPKNIDSLGVTISDDLMYVLNWCDAVNVLRVQNERMDINYFPSNREYNQNFGINKHLEKLRKKLSFYTLAQLIEESKFQVKSQTQIIL